MALFGQSLAAAAIAPPKSRPETGRAAHRAVLVVGRPVHLARIAIRVREQRAGRLLAQRADRLAAGEAAGDLEAPAVVLQRDREAAVGVDLRRAAGDADRLVLLAAVVFDLEMQRGDLAALDGDRDRKLLARAARIDPGWRGGGDRRRKQGGHNNSSSEQAGPGVHGPTVTMCGWSMLRSLAAASRGSVRPPRCATRASRTSCCSRPATVWVGRGTGTRIPGSASTSPRSATSSPTASGPTGRACTPRAAS